MKTKFTGISVVFFMLFSSVSMHARSLCGIYLTESDYIHNKLSYTTGCKIRLNNSFWELPFIKVVDHNKKHKFKKNAIFGYVDEYGHEYRFYGKTEYLTLEKGIVNIYQKAACATQNKGFKLVMEYYFSSAPEGKIVPLTLANLENAYGHNEKFVYMLDRYFGNGEVAAYDRKHKKFCVNYLYAKVLEHGAGSDIF